MSGRAILRVLLLSALAAAGLVAGCRWPDTTLVKKQNLGTIYDTKQEKLLDSGKAGPLLEQAWRDDVPVYAEPVAIRTWRDGISTWEIFFATNRAVEQTRDGGELFGTDPLEAPLYGRADVTVPRRRRGMDPRREPTSGKRDKASESADTATLDRIERLALDEFIAGVTSQVERSRQHDVLVFVHGFNVGFDACLVRTAQIALDMPFNGAVVAYSWPSLASMTRYHDDEKQNAKSVEPFREFVTQLRAGLPDDARIHIVVHSMGNRIVVGALSQLPSPGSTPPIDNLVLCAPDVGLAQFRESAPALVRQCRRLTLYASTHDGALILSKGVNSEQRAGDAHPPLVLSGIETVDCSAIDATSFLGHSYYSGNVDVLSDLFQLIKRDRAAANRIHLKEKEGRTGRYWRWAGTAPHDIWTWHFDDLAEQAPPETAERPGDRH